MVEKDLSEQIEERIIYAFTVKYYGTPENVAVHNAFKEYCRNNTDSNYLQGIKRLLELSTVDWKYESLHDEILELRNAVSLLEQEKVPVVKNPVIKTFG
jgi:hypothetical protein